MWILLSCMIAAQATEPAHLKPDALVGHMGLVALVEDVLWVKYPYANLRTIPQRLKAVAAEINSALVQLEKEAYKNHTDSQWDDPLALLKVYALRIAFVNDTVALALETYIGLEDPAREKRAWLEPLGELSHDLFGTAMQSDVDELRNRYNQPTLGVDSSLCTNKTRYLSRYLASNRELHDRNCHDPAGSSVAKSATQFPDILAKFPF